MKQQVEGKIYRIIFDHQQSVFTPQK